MSGRPPAIGVALVLALAVTALWWQLAERRARTAEASLAAARGRIAALADSLAASRRGAAAGSAHGHLPAGSAASERAVLDDLARHPELIPFPGTGGGAMRFYASQSRLIAPGWAYGYFEDGHVSGRGLFEYRVARDGSVTWKRLAATLD